MDKKIGRTESARSWSHYYISSHFFCLTTRSVCLHTMVFFFLFNLSYIGMISFNPIDMKYNWIASSSMLHFQIWSENKKPTLNRLCHVVFGAMVVNSCGYPENLTQCFPCNSRIFFHLKWTNTSGIWNTLFFFFYVWYSLQREIENFKS